VVESCDGLGTDGRLLPWPCRSFPIDGISTVPVYRQLSSDSVQRRTHAQHVLLRIDVEDGAEERIGIGGHTMMAEFERGGED
jgi:hypothetical protein